MRFFPLDGRKDGFGGGNLVFADEDGEPAAGIEELGCCGKDLVEVFNGAKGDGVEGFGEQLGAGGLNFDTSELKGADDFAEESGFLLVRFDKGDVKLRSCGL